MVGAAASTNTPSLAMSASQLAELVENDMHVSADEKVACVNQYTKAMAAPVCSCASCGVRTATEMPGAALEERMFDPAIGGRAGAGQESQGDEPYAWADVGPWVGRATRRFFRGNACDGTVSKYLPESDGEAALWRVVMVDGDVEDLEEVEVVCAMYAFHSGATQQPTRGESVAWAGAEDPHDAGEPDRAARAAAAMPSPGAGGAGGSTSNADLHDWAHLEVRREYLREAHPSVPSLRGYDVCLLAAAYPDYPIGGDAVGWRAKVRRQRKVRVRGRVHVQVDLFEHWHDLEGGDVVPICQVRDAAPGRASVPCARTAEYTWYRLDELSVLRLTVAERATWRAASERLCDFPLLGPMGTVEHTVDLSRVCSVYEAPGGGEYFWLHPDLVDVRGPEPACLICRKCTSALRQGVRPSMNVANVDYGNLARVPELGTLSVLEELLLSPNRLYHVVVKVRAWAPPCRPPAPSRPDRLSPRADTNVVRPSRGRLFARRPHLLPARGTNRGRAGHRRPSRVDPREGGHPVRAGRRGLQVGQPPPVDAGNQCG